ncbi:MAG TPA: zinc-ribbon domain-containing protein [Caldilineae bacterium]|nr:zinc-ribbon domain-containing protein [Caldilineae bacterium]
MGTRYCTQCGAELKPGVRFCTTCGAKVKQGLSRSRSKPHGKSRRRATRRSPSFTYLALGVGVLVILIGVLIAINTSRSTPLASEIPDIHDESGIPYPDVPRISVEEAKARYDAGTAIFVDVRSVGEYETAHIPNAVSLPLADLEARYQELPRDAEIITYCT